MSAEAAAMGGHGQSGAHASTRFYWTIGIILTVITGAEVAAFYITALAGVLAPLLLVLSAAKFIMVVMFFMHLKFDSKIFTVLFVSGLMLATFMTVALIILFHVLPKYAF